MHDVLGDPTAHSTQIRYVDQSANPETSIDMGAQRQSIGTHIGLPAAALVLMSGGALAVPPLSQTETTHAEEIAARRELVEAAFQWLDATLARDFVAQS